MTEPLYFPGTLDQVYQMDALELLKALPADCVDCCITSPPYYGLRDYGVDGQIGLEDTPQAYVKRLADLFREVKRVLKDTGTCWINLGDSYSTAQTVSNFLNLLHASIEKGVLFIGTRCTLTVTAHSDSVLKSNEIAPDDKFTRFLGIKRITFKQRDGDFSQVVNLLQSEANAILSSSVCFRVENADILEIIVH